MSFATLVYNVAAAVAGATNTDLTAATDDDFSQRNSHYIFSEPYRILMAYAGGANLTRGRILAPTINSIGELALMNVNRSLDPPSNPQVDSYYDSPIDLPINEEVQVQLSNNLGAATENENVILWLIPPDWNANLTRGRATIKVRTSQSITQVLNGWSATTALTFDAALRGGVYAVLGAQCQSDDAIAFRILFPRQRLNRGRRLRPGGIVTNAVGNVMPTIPILGAWKFGEWGRFHTFEPPQLQCFGTVAGAETVQLWMDLAYLGEDTSLLAAG